ncbi:hypothetical protein DFH09DRAFT_1083294 [Mycena vulgaris]|nr:hypothetical protein DFH09DRAFT_1083294 [Mycena vulgaris]
MSLWLSGCPPFLNISFAHRVQAWRKVDYFVSRLNKGYWLSTAQRSACAGEPGKAVEEFPSGVGGFGDRGPGAVVLEAKEAEEEVQPAEDTECLNVACDAVETNAGWSVMKAASAASMPVCEVRMKADDCPFQNNPGHESASRPHTIPHSVTLDSNERRTCDTLPPHSTQTRPPSKETRLEMTTHRHQVMRPVPLILAMLTTPAEHLNMGVRRSRAECRGEYAGKKPQPFSSEVLQPGAIRVSHTRPAHTSVPRTVPAGRTWIWQPRRASVCDDAAHGAHREGIHAAMREKGAGEDTPRSTWEVKLRSGEDVRAQVYGLLKDNDPHLRFHGGALRSRGIHNFEVDESSVSPLDARAASGALPRAASLFPTKLHTYRSFILREPPIPVSTLPIVLYVLAAGGSHLREYGCNLYGLLHAPYGYNSLLPACFKPTFGMDQLPDPLEITKDVSSFFCARSRTFAWYID